MLDLIYNSSNYNSFRRGSFRYSAFGRIHMYHCTYIHSRLPRDTLCRLFVCARRRMYLARYLDCDDMRLIVSLVVVSHRMFCTRHESLGRFSAFFYRVSLLHKIFPIYLPFILFILFILFISWNFAIDKTR